MNNEQILKVACYAGYLLLKNGAEIYRVEDTITHILHSYGVEEGNAFVIPNALFVSFTNHGESFSKIIRVKEGSKLDIHKINALNEFSRQCSHYQISYEDTMYLLKEIEGTHLYSFFKNLFVAAFASFFFTLFFQGTLIESACAFVIGFIAQWFSAFMDKHGVHSLVRILLASALLTLCALLFTYLGIAENKDSMIIGTLMLLVPGLAITNAVRDSISGDLLSGVARAIEAVLIAVVIALGSGITMILWMQWIGGAI